MAASHCILCYSKNMLPATMRMTGTLWEQSRHSTTMKCISRHCATLWTCESLTPLHLCCAAPSHEGDRKHCSSSKYREWRTLTKSNTVTYRQLSNTSFLRTSEKLGESNHGEDNGRDSPSQMQSSDAAASSELKPFDEQNIAMLEQDILSEPDSEFDVDILAQTEKPEIIDTFVEMPLMPESYTLASYVEHSATLQKLVQMGVDLSRVQRRKGVANMLVQMDFERDIKDKLALLHHIGVTADQLGGFVTKNPHILGEKLQNLEARVHYLHKKNFSDADVCQIVNRAPYFLSFSIERIDSKLGFFQQLFGFSDNEVRQVITRCPKLATMKVSHPKENLFVLEYQLGFSNAAIKTMVLKEPSILLRGKFQLIAVFDYLHNMMNVPHKVLLKSPEVFCCRVQRLQDRHKYLTMLKRNQYDPTEPGYVPLMALFKLPDGAFCQEIAKTSSDTYHQFLKTCRV